MYLFLRRQSISSTGALFGAATFAFAGYMTAQIVHIDLIEGAAWMPWTLVAVHALTAGPAATGRRGTARPADASRAVLLAASLGLSVLTGSAEAIIDSSVLVAIYAVGRLVTMGYLQPDRAGEPWPPRCSACRPGWPAVSPWARPSGCPASSSSPSPSGPSPPTPSSPAARCPCGW